MKKTITCITISFLFLLAYFNPAYAAPIVKIVPAEKIIPEKILITGNTFDADVIIENVDEPIGAFEFEIAYPGDIIEIKDPVNHVRKGDFLEGISLPPLINNGKIRYGLSSYDVSSKESGILATITFTLKTQMSGDLNLTEVLLTDHVPITAETYGIGFTPCYIKAASDSNGAIAPTGYIPLICGASRLFTITPNDCYHILDVKIDGVSEGAPVSYTFPVVTTHQTIDASFDINKYTVDFAAVTGGSITGDNTQTVNCGSNCAPVTATPDSKYEFLNWTWDTTSSTNNPFTYVSVTSDKTITANFIPVYTVNFGVSPVGSGNITGNTTQIIREGGNCTEVTAVTNTGYHFVNWTLPDGTVLSTNPSLTYGTVTQDTTINANFAIDTHTVIFKSNPADCGIITGDNTQVISHNNNCSPVKAVPNIGCNFLSWKWGTTGSSSNTELTYGPVTSDMTVYANFSGNIYDVIFTAGDNGKVNGNKIVSQKVEHGKSTNPPVTAEADICYRFVKWSGVSADKESQNPLIIDSVVNPMNITANFDIAGTYTVSITSDPNGKIEGNTVQQIQCGKECTSVKAVPNSCYKFKEWTGDYNGTENPLTITNVTKNMNIKAVFEKILSIVIGINGTCGKVEPPAVECGVSNIQITAIPANDCCGFTGWSGSYIGTENPLKLSNITDNMNITANFETIPYQVLFQQGENGTLIGNTLQTVNCGGCAESAVTAVPNDCYTFKSWSGAYTGTQNPLPVCDVRKDMTIKPVFEIIKYPVIFTAGVNGKITGETSQTADCNKCATEVKAEPNDCYKFTGWSGDYTGTDNPLKICNVRKPMNITANFEIIKYPVNFISGANGKITGETSQTVDCNKCTTEVKAEPNPCYRFTGWSGDHTGTENPICNINKPMDITANFEIIPYTVTFTYGKNGKLTGNTTQTVNCGGCLNSDVKAEPDDCYQFLVWDGDYHGTENPPKICNIKKDMKITPIFESRQYTVNFKDSENGKITGKLSQSVNCNGCAESVIVVPDPCYQFKEWTGDYTGTENNLNLCNITRDMTVTTVFEIRTYDVIFTSNENGKIEGEVFQKGLKCGSNSLPVEAFPNAGYEFTGWSGSYIGTENPLTLSNITDNMNITANFAPIKCASIFRG